MKEKKIAIYFYVYSFLTPILIHCFLFNIFYYFMQSKQFNKEIKKLLKKNKMCRCFMLMIEQMILTVSTAITVATIGMR